MATSKAKRPGPKSWFPGKVRKPVTLTLTQAHHDKVKESRRRLGNITRAELIGLLIEKYADVVAKVRPGTYERLSDAVGVLGGSLTCEPWNGPRGAKWMISLGGKAREVDPKVLDDCYSRNDNARVGEFDPAGLAKLFNWLASAQDSEAN